MQLSDVASLVKLLDKSSLTEISFSDETSKIVLKKEVAHAASLPPMMSMPMAISAPAAPAPAQAAPVSVAAAAQAAGPSANASKFKDVNSPMVGTFYASNTPGGAPLVNVGTAVKSGQVLCIIEAMKIMNEIESDVTGVIEEVCVQNEMPVEYGTVLFRIRPG